LRLIAHRLFLDLHQRHQHLGTPTAHPVKLGSPPTNHEDDLKNAILVRGLGLAFGVPIAMLIALSVVSYRTVTTSNAETAWLLHTHQVLEKSAGLLSATQDSRIWPGCDRLVNVAFIEVIKVSFGCLVVIFTPFRTPPKNTGQTHQKRSDHLAGLSVELFHPSEGCRHSLSDEHPHGVLATYGRIS
jgi:hypothetical protein